VLELYYKVDDNCIYLFFKHGLGLGLLFNSIFSNISAISWWSFLLVEITGVPEENHRQSH